MRLLEIKIYNNKNIYSDKKIAVIFLDASLEKAKMFSQMCIHIQKLIGYNLVEYFECIKENECVRAMVEHDNEKVILGVIELALECVQNDLKLESMQDKVLRLKRLAIETELSPNVRLLKNACVRRGIRFSRIGWTDTCILGEGKWAKVFYGLHTDIQYNKFMLSQDREIQRNILSSYALPIPKYKVVFTQEEFLQALKEIGYPVTIKGCSKNSSIFLNIRTNYQAMECFNQLKTQESRIIVERFIKGFSYKILVINGKIIAAIKRSSPYIIGDGVKKIEQLLSEKDKIDKGIQRTILKQGFNIDDILPKGMKLFLKEATSFKNSCIIEDVTEFVHSVNQKVICNAIERFGYQFGCIDFVTDDISLPWTTIGGYIVDVELNPNMRLFSQNCNVDIFNTLIDLYFEKMSNPSIPLFIVSGTYGKSTVLQIINYIFLRCGFEVSIEKDIKDFYIRNISDTSDIKLIEFEPSKCIEEIEVEPLVGIITNTQDETQIERNLLIVKSIKDSGCLILNVEDRFKYLYSSKAKCKVVFTSITKDHPDLKACIELKKPCVYLKRNIITLFDGVQEYELCDIGQIPYSYEGRLKFAIENILQVVAALYFYGMDLEIIYRFLVEYKNDSYQNPGKFNIFDINGVKVIIDDIRDRRLIEIVKNGLKSIGIGRILYVCDEKTKNFIDKDENMVFSKKIASFNDVIELIGAAMKEAKKGNGVFILLPEPLNKDVMYEIRERLSSRKKSFV